MDVIKSIKKLIPFKHKRTFKEKLGVPTLHWSLENLRKKNFLPGVVLDIGAYEGNWTLDLLEVFPQAKVLMVEAQEAKKPFLEAVKSKYPFCDYSINLLSATNNSYKFFLVNETASHITTGGNNGFDIIQLPSITLDTLLEQINFPFPDLLKLDVQGHEMEVLKGAEKCLYNATLCLLEVSLIDLGGGVPLLADMITYMNDKGFQTYDICQLMRRPLDKALFQVDMLFVKKDSNLIADKSW